MWGLPVTASLRQNMLTFPSLSLGVSKLLVVVVVVAAFGCEARGIGGEGIVGGLRETVWVGSLVTGEDDVLMSMSWPCNSHIKYLFICLS